MGAYTSTQLMVRLLALLLGLAGGLCQTVWSQVVGMRCGATEIGEYVFHTECLAWTELFLRFPQDASAQMVSIVLAAAIAGMVAGLGGMWRSRWAALLFLLLAAWNLGLLVYRGDGHGSEEYRRYPGCSFNRSARSVRRIALVARRVSGDPSPDGRSG